MISMSEKNKALTEYHNSQHKAELCEQLSKHKKDKKESKKALFEA